jgi:excinuclease ABC subunit A
LKRSAALSILFSENFACAECGFSFEEISPRIFSFNSPYGACPECSGLGTKAEFAAELVIPFPELSIAKGQFTPGQGKITTSSFSSRRQKPGV